ncbi:unnamed protein product [Camellia sinensis]
MVLHEQKQKQNQAIKGDNRLLVIITVLGSAGRIRFIVHEGELVAAVMETAIKSYARQGRLSVLGSNLNDFFLCSPIAGPEVHGRQLGQLELGISCSARSPSRRKLSLMSKSRGIMTLSVALYICGSITEKHYTFGAELSRKNEIPASRLGAHSLPKSNKNNVLSTSHSKHNQIGQTEKNGFIYIVQKSARIQDPFKNTKSSSNKAKAGCDSSSLSAKSPLQHPRRNMVLFDSETVRWLNHVVEKIWPVCMEPIVSQKILLPSIPWFLEKYKPWTVHLYMGRSPPVFTEMRVLHQTTDDDHLPSMKVFNDMLHELDIGRNNPDGADQGFIGSYFPDLLDQPMFHPPLNGYQACWNIQTSFGISNGCLLLLMETAINIAYACKLIDNDMKQFIISSEIDEIREVESRGDQVVDSLSSHPTIRPMSHPKRG